MMEQRNAGFQLTGWLVRILVVGLLLAGAGCTQQGTVTGKVSYKGKKIPGGTVDFMTVAGGHVVHGNIDRDGNFTVSKVPPGMVKIAVHAAVPPPAPPGGMKRPAGGPMQMPAASTMMEGADRPLDPSEYVKVPEKYTDIENSGLTYDVTPGPQTHDIDMP